MNYSTTEFGLKCSESQSASRASSAFCGAQASVIIQYIGVYVHVTCNPNHYSVVFIHWVSIWGRWEGYSSVLSGDHVTWPVNNMGNLCIQLHHVRYYYDEMETSWVKVKGIAWTLRLPQHRSYPGLLTPRAPLGRSILILPVFSCMRVYELRADLHVTTRCEGLTRHEITA